MQTAAAAGASSYLRAANTSPVVPFGQSDRKTKRIKTLLLHFCAEIRAERHLFKRGLPAPRRPRAVAVARLETRLSFSLTFAIGAANWRRGRRHRFIVFSQRVPPLGSSSKQNGKQNKPRQKSPSLLGRLVVVA